LHRTPPFEFRLTQRGNVSQLSKPLPVASDTYFSTTSSQFSGYRVKARCEVSEVGALAITCP